MTRVKIVLPFAVEDGRGHRLPEVFYMVPGQVQFPTVAVEVDRGGWDLTEREVTLIERASHAAAADAMLMEFMRLQVRVTLVDEPVAPYSTSPS